MATNPCEYNCGRIDALEFEPRVKPRPPATIGITQEVYDRVDRAIDAYSLALLQANENADAEKESLLTAAKEQLAISKKFEEANAKAYEGIAKLLNPSEPAPLPVIAVEDHSIAKYENFVGTPANLDTWFNSLGLDLPTPIWDYASELSDKPPPSGASKAAKGHLGAPNPVVLEIPLG